MGHAECNSSGALSVGRPSGHPHPVDAIPHRGAQFSGAIVSQTLERCCEESAGEGDLTERCTSAIAILGRREWKPPHVNATAFVHTAQSRRPRVADPSGETSAGQDDHGNRCIATCGRDGTPSWLGRRQEGERYAEGAVDANAQSSNKEGLRP